MFFHRIVVSNGCCLLCYQFPTLLFPSLLIKKITYFFFFFHVYFFYIIFYFIYSLLYFFHFYFFCDISELQKYQWSILITYFLITLFAVCLFGYFLILSCFLFCSFVSFLIYHISPLSSQDFWSSKKKSNCSISIYKNKIQIKKISKKPLKADLSWDKDSDIDALITEVSLV